MKGIENNRKVLAIGVFGVGGRKGVSVFAIRGLFHV